MDCFCFLISDFDQFLSVIGRPSAERYFQFLTIYTGQESLTVSYIITFFPPIIYKVQLNGKGDIGIQSNIDHLLHT